MKRLIFLAVLFIGGCGIAVDGAKYDGQQSILDPTVFFNGKVKGWGIVQDRRGNVIQQFQVDLNGELDERSNLVLNEVFQYQIGDGLKTRKWTIAKQKDEYTYLGRADDIVGEANGQTFGNALQWRYEMDLPVDGGTYRVVFDDWMWRFNDGTVINRSYIKKFGVVFAEVTIFFQRNKP